MKLFLSFLHHIKQNPLKMKSPPNNEREFACLVKEHSRISNKVCFFYATDKVPFEDLRQEIYVNLWLGLKQFRGDSKLSTWIYRVAVNSALMAIRSYRSKVDTLPIDLSSCDPTSEFDDEQKEQLQAMYELINTLPQTPLHLS